LFVNLTKMFKIYTDRERNLYIVIYKSETDLEERFSCIIISESLRPKVVFSDCDF